MNRYRNQLSGFPRHWRIGKGEWVVVVYKVSVWDYRVAWLWEFVREIRYIFKIVFRMLFKAFDLSSRKYRNFLITQGSLVLILFHFLHSSLTSSHRPCTSSHYLKQTLSLQMYLLAIFSESSLPTLQKLCSNI